MSVALSWPSNWTGSHKLWFPDASLGWSSANQTQNYEKVIPPYSRYFLAKKIRMDNIITTVESIIFEGTIEKFRKIQFLYTETLEISINNSNNKCDLQIFRHANNFSSIIQELNFIEELLANCLTGPKSPDTICFCYKLASSNNIRVHCLWSVTKSFY